MNLWHLSNDGTNKIFETEIDIDINLKEYSNEIYAVPVRKGINLIEEGLFKMTYFNYENHKDKDKSNKKTLIIVFTIIGAILVIVAVLIIYYKVCKKKQNSIEDLNEPITDGNIELN